jgi:hypothetical protein
MTQSPRAIILAPWAITLVLATGALAQDDGLAAPATADLEPPPPEPVIVLTDTGTDTLRTNLEVAEALLGEALELVIPELPSPPAAVVLVPGSTEDAAALLSRVAVHRLQLAGYEVHLDQLPEASDLAVVEMRYRVEDLQLAYPTSGRRLLFWKSWVGREMNLAVTMTLVDAADGQIIMSRRVASSFRDRIPAGDVDAVESPTYEFTQAEPDPSKSSRRLEQVVVLGALVGLVAIYFANTE